jgi:23S rRNA (cytidine1920-2'-O)/16S rRNA (cytidine1409-2'-O)-methyltransferase
MRLDQALAETYHLTRNRAQQLISAGLVSVNGKMILKASYSVTSEDTILLQEDKKIHWVSRSAEKLDGFLEQFPLNLTGKIGLDVGSSTGGFTQVLLERWIEQVDAVDVGTDQLHSSLQNHPQISLYEQTDIRVFHEYSQKIYDIIVCDASFISLREIIPSMLLFADEQTDIILLYKPQFEVGPEYLRKTGVPKDEKRVWEVMEWFEQFLDSKNMKILQRIPSTLKWEAGNQEWIYHLKKQ